MATIPGAGGSSYGIQAQPLRSNEVGSTSGGSDTTHTSDSCHGYGNANDTSPTFSCAGAGGGGGPQSDLNCSLSCELAPTLEIEIANSEAFPLCEEFPLCAVNAEPFLRQASFVYYELAMSPQVSWSDLNLSLCNC